MSKLHNKKGFSVVEILIAIGMTAIMIVSIGGALNSVHKLNKTSEIKEKALAYAKEYIEIINAVQNDEFGCKCTDPACSNCLCIPMPNYTSCWLATPGSDLNAKYYINTVNQQLLIGIETVGSYNRWINIKNLAGPNKKQIDVTVQEQATGKEVKLSTILTAWKNIP